MPPVARADGENQRLSPLLEARVAECATKLAAAREELDAFNYSISHDLRAPLRHIAGFVDILETAAGPTMDATSRKHLQTVAQSAAQMGQMIDGLLELYRVGHAEMRCHRVSLATLVGDARGDLRGEIGSREINWQIGDLPEVRADSVLLSQAIGNLLSNAVKFTHPRSVARIEIGGTHDGSENILFVRDNGAGFDMKCAGRLFGVFQRLHLANKFKGIGVGLAIVRRIIHRHGGRTWAEGKPEGGATFYLSIPNSPEESA